MRLRSLVFAMALGSPGILAACAQGSQVDLGSGGAAGEGGTGGEGGNRINVGTGSSTASASASGSSSSSGTGGSTSGSSSSSGTGGSPCSFQSPNGCATADILNSVSGDNGGLTSTSGVGSRWFKIHVTEDDSSIFPTDLSYLVTLTSPPGMDYDLYVHEGPQDGNPDCNAPELKGSPSGSSEEVYDAWNDDQGLGGEDDSLWLSIEVRYVSGMDCNATWSLTIEGGV